MVCPAGIEPAHMASEANALSPELRAQLTVSSDNNYYNISPLTCLTINYFFYMYQSVLDNKDIPRNLF